ncbi:MAG: hypothetical protein A3C35_07400 [Omnitrophica bacterium RIFCSPHIGHO2_02_FULL_46_11]|nr:MAG: hypothetical protein A3C35_07400 [Omnitrophica bacterium RIFCSPHIGHO2_02_FULL_46_11]OGW87353.1 MAG: hypothetical protein A3A81_04495 [Omnitrophica bacterium RIFCSPLOWO2_01_FULL_45_10b]
MSAQHSFGRREADFVSKHAVWILSAIVLISLATIPLAGRLKLKANLLDLLPKTMPSVANLNRLTEEVGGTSFLVVIIESPDEETAHQVADRFSKQAESFEDIDYVDNRTDLSALQSRKLLFLSLDGLKKLEQHAHQLMGHYRRKLNPFFVDLLDEAPPVLDIQSLELEEKLYAIGGFARKEKKLFMRVVLLKPNYPATNFERSERLFQTTWSAFEEIRDELPKRYPVKLGLTGPYKTRYDEYHVIVGDLKLTSFLTITFITFLMAIFFRNFKSIILAYLPLGVGVLWTCAFAQLAIGYLNLISAFLLGILCGMGIDFAVHFLVSFSEGYKETRNTRRSLERAYTELGKPSLTSSLTNSITFFSMTISQFEGFKHFGLIAGAGILLCFAVFFYGLPSLLVVFQRARHHKWSPPSFLKESWLNPRRGPIYALLAAGIIFSGFSMAQIPRLNFDYNFENLQEKNGESMVLAEQISEYFGVVLNPVVLMTPSRQRASELALLINRYIESHPDSTFDFAASVLSYIPKHQEEKIALMRQMNELLEQYTALIEKLDQEQRDQVFELKRQLQATPLTVSDLPSELRAQYEGKSGKVSTVFVYPKLSLLDGQMAKRFVAELRNLGFPEDVTIAGEPVVYADILMLLEQDTPRAMLVSLGVVIALLFLHFRRPNHVMWVLSPLMIGFLWLAGMAGLFGLKFNYMNVAVLPSILGVGIDNGIYIFHRYKKEKKLTLFDIMRTTGKAVILCSLTTMAAFASLFFARHRGMSSMGQIGFFGFGSCLLASVLFIPALIEFLELKYWHPFRGKK